MMRLLPFAVLVWIVLAPAMARIALSQTGPAAGKRARSAIAQSNSSADVVKGPRLVIDSVEMDAGEVLRGEIARYKFAIRNTGSAPLEIAAEPACGCTLARYDETIEPGEEGKIEAELRTNSFTGKVEKTISVTTNDPKCPGVQLRLLATVRELVEMEVNAQRTLYLIPGEVLREGLRFHVQRPDVRIVSVSCDASYVRPVLRDGVQTDSGTRIYEIELEVAPDAPFGRSEFQLQIITDAPDQKAQVVQLACEKGIVAPAMVSFAGAAAKGNTPLRQTCVLRTKDIKINIQSIESTDPQINATVREFRGGTLQMIELTARSTSPVDKVPRLLRVKTDSPHQPLLEIPIACSYAEERALNGGQYMLGSRGSLARGTGEASPRANGSLKVPGLEGNTVFLTHGEEFQKSFRLTVRSEEDVSIISAACDVPFARADVTRDKLDSRAYDLKITLAPDSPFGRSMVVITLQTTSVLRPQETIRFFVNKGIVASVPVVSFGTIRSGVDTPVKRGVTLASTQGPFEVTSVKSDDPHVQVTARPMKNGKMMAVILSCDGDSPVGHHKGNVRIETDRPDQPSLIVEFSYDILPPD